MNPDNFFLVVFVLLLIILTIFFPISGYYKVKKQKKNVKGDLKKISFYQDTILWSWLPVLLIFLAIIYSGISIDKIGLKWIDIDITSLSKWVAIPVIGLYFIYLINTFYLIIFHKRSNESRSETEKGIINNFRWFLPITRKEKRVWILLALSAGITEEIVYRGYLFYALAVFFPGLSLIQIVLISTLIFGVGHVYLGKEVIKSTFLGLLFGLSYIVFDSVIPVIIIHIAQDLVMTNLIETEFEE